MRCHWCDGPFTPHRFTPKDRQRFCSARCRQQHTYYEARATESEQGEPT